MAVKTVEDLNLKGKRVLVRVDFNVPIKGDVISDDTRIRAALPTLKYILEQDGASLILMSHLGRPKGERNLDFTLKPVADRLSELLGKSVTMADDCVGDSVKRLVSGMKSGDVVLLENVRFHAGEEKNDPVFAKELASLADVSSVRAKKSGVIIRPAVSS